MEELGQDEVVRVVRIDGVPWSVDCWIVLVGRLIRFYCDQKTAMVEKQWGGAMAVGSTRP